MIRMPLVPLLLIAALGLASPAAAESSFLSELEDFRAQLLEDRREVVKTFLDLNANEEAAFWPVYEDYQEAVEAYRRRRMNMVLDFLENGGTYGRSESIELMRDWLAMKQDWVGLERAWLGEFLSVLPAQKAMRYYQIENKIDALINAELASFVPLAGAGEQG